MRSILIFLGFLKLFLCQEDFPLVNSPSGTVQGMRKISRLDPNVDFYAYRGIPYAAPPVGNLRFKEPQPVTPWAGIHNGTKVGNACPQLLDGQFYLGDEDCLNLDVYTPTTVQGALRPVMFWVYGGAYETGANAIYGADVMLKHDVVLVVINYRLGVFGFLSTGDQSAWGNMALKDQVLALQWVRDNIGFFGGDPNLVTIFGESAGASSVHYLQISPLAAGLFHRILVHSGCAIAPWAITKDPMPYILNMTNHFGIASDTTDNIITGLQQIDTRTLLEASHNASVTGYEDPAVIPPFFPVIEANHAGAFVSQSGLQMLEAGNYNHVPFFFGHTTAEGAFGLDYLLTYYTMEDFDTRPEFILSPSLNGPDNPHRVGQIVRDFFIGNVTAAENVQGVLRLLTHELYVRGMRKAIDIQRANEEGYWYRFSYEASAGIGYPGVDHSEDLQYYWYMPNVDYTTYTAADFLTLDRVSKLFSNFARFGDPTPMADPLFNNLTYPKVTAADIGFVDIGVELVPGSMPNETEYLFWTDIFNTYGKPPFITY